ncbi:MAG: AAA family ATPase [Thermoflexales bacterium]|nr:AAA family ATPase [Thermoflexales bacterium]
MKEEFTLSASLEIMASYVPALIVRRLAADPRPLNGPLVERFPAAVMFTDISGFTPLAERLSRHGPAGTEHLSRALNDYFGQLIDLVVAHGGDVIKFAGDGLLTLWQGQPLPESTLRAAQCGLAIQAALHNYEAGEGVRLTTRVGVGAGQVSSVHAGGVYGRWEFLVAGPPLTQMGIANHLAQPGQVALSAEAWALVQNECSGAPIPSAAGSRPPAGCVHIEAVRTPLPPCPLSPVGLRPDMEAALQAYLPGAIRARLEAGQSEWLAEQRRVTVLFVNLPAVPDALELAQMLMQSLQTTLYRYEGSIRQFIVDDKGATLIAVLGLPPLAHEDDAARGVLAGMEMSAELRRLGLRGAIGITTGQVFCGIVGSPKRREYASIGDVVNLSARLMGAASRRTEKKRLLILCDEATYQAAGSRVEFETLPKINVKGKAEPLGVYCPLGRKKTVLRPRTALVGRSNERIVLADALQALLIARAGGSSPRDGKQSPANPVVILEGEAGIGKSRLVQELCRQAEAFRVMALYGTGDAMEQSTPYYAWREVFDQILSLGGELTLPLSTPEARQAYILEWLEKIDPQLVRLAPLLNPILLVNLSDNELTAQMDRQVRADNTHDLVLRLLQATASRSPLLIVLEDAQWMDAVSWGLAAAVSLHVSPVLVAVATRPLGAGWQVQTEPPPGYRQMLGMPGARHIRLEELKRWETTELICQRLGVSSLSESLTHLLNKAEGHPFFAEELAYTLRDHGLLQIAGDECHLAVGAGDWHTIEFPHTVQGAITSRVDHLAPAEQLTLKVASIIGRVFDAQLLDAIYPIESDKAQLASHLSHLEQLELVTRLSPDSEIDYVFKHAITREVVYNLMSYAQRQELHRAAAAWYERTHPDDFYHGVLVHHWAQAGDVPKALDYLEKTGQEALRNGAHQEAAHLFSQALELEQEARRAASPDQAPKRPSAQATTPWQLRRARWERLLGEALWEAGNVTASFMHTRIALEILGRPEPTSRTGQLVALSRQALLQGLHRLWPARFLGRQQGDVELVELGRAYQRLTMAYYFNNQIARAFHTGLCHLNLAERANLGSAELAEGYVIVGGGLGILALHPLAQVYRRLAQAAVLVCGSSSAQAYMLEYTAAYDTGLGRWEQAEASLEQARQIYERLGNWRGVGECLNWLALASYYHGDCSYHELAHHNWASIAEAGVQVHALGTQRSNLQLQTWGLNLQAMYAVQQGQYEPTIACLEAAWELLTHHNLERITAILNRAVLAVTYLRQGRLRAAREVVYNVGRLIQGSRPVWAVAFDGYAAMAQVYLAVWEAEQIAQSEGKDEGADVRARAQKACRDLHAFARVFPIGRPRAWLYQGWYEWLAGNRSKAGRLWRKSLGEGQKLDMPYEQGLALYELGRRASLPERTGQLQLACDFFRRSGAAYDLSQVEAALETN